MNHESGRSLPKEIRTVIAQLRSRIRGYVWLEGIAIVVAWIGLTFWIGLALDYLPVLLGSSEMPRPARLILLSGVVLGAIVLFYRNVIRRAFTQFADTSMALLIERKFPEFQESLVTTVQYESESGKAEGVVVDPGMLERTKQLAIERIQQVRLGEIFNLRPLIKSLCAAAIALVSIGVFALASQDAFATWTNRFYRLSDEPWPRRVHIELLGFENRLKKVAEGADVTIQVRADATRPTPPPNVCTIYYRLEGGERGSVNMSKNGEPREGFQYYSFSSTPFKGMLENIEFDVVGFDHRIRGYQIEVVPSPVITDVRVRSQAPKYTGLLARDEKWSLGTRLPIGSRIEIRAKANKPLTHVELSTVGDDEPPIRLAPDKSDPTQFVLQVPELRERFTRNIVLLDRDDIESQQPFRLTIGIIRDEPPEVSIELQGIGDAITPDAVIAVKGKASDDYDVADAWFNLNFKVSEKRQGSERRFPISLPSNGEVRSKLDLRELRSENDDPFEVEIGEELVLTVQAHDHYDLEENPNLGVSEAYELRVVEPSELLALLEARELGLRRRFEQIISEMTETRDTIARIEADAKERLTVDPVDQDAPEAKLKSLGSLRAQRARQQGEKSVTEIAGVTAAFESIRDELVNNRVDTEERRLRIEQQIVEPLKDITDLMFPDWDDSLEQLVQVIESAGDVQPAAAESLRLTDNLLLAMEKVLQKMEELESYNELVDLVRSIIKEQEQLLEKTKQERKNQAKSLLE